MGGMQIGKLRQILYLYTDKSKFVTLHQTFDSMTPKVDKAIYIVLGSVLILSILAYLIFGKEWARLPFYLSLCLVSLYNLFFNRPGSGTKKE